MRKWTIMGLEGLCDDWGWCEPDAAGIMGVGVATFIKIAVKKEISAMGLDQEYVSPEKN